MKDDNFFMDLFSIFIILIFHSFFINDIKLKVKEEYFFYYI